MEGGSLLDKLYIKNSFVFQEFDEVENNYWFDFKQKNFCITLIHFIIPSNLNKILPQDRKILR